MKRKIERAVENAMTVADLIEELKQMPQDAYVLFACDYGNYSHTQQALPVENAEELDAGSLVESAYSHSRIALTDEQDNPSYYCPACEEEWDAKTCPKCHGCCITEDGTPAKDQDNDEPETIVILR